MTKIASFAHDEVWTSPDGKPNDCAREQEWETWRHGRQKCRSGVVSTKFAVTRIVLCWYVRFLRSIYLFFSSIYSETDWRAKIIRPASTWYRHNNVPTRFVHVLARRWLSTRIIEESWRETTNVIFVPYIMNAFFIVSLRIDRPQTTEFKWLNLYY